MTTTVNTPNGITVGQLVGVAILYLTAFDRANNSAHDLTDIVGHMDDMEEEFRRIIWNITQDNLLGTWSHTDLNGTTTGTEINYVAVSKLIIALSRHFGEYGALA